MCCQHSFFCRHVKLSSYKVIAYNPLCGPELSKSCTCVCNRDETPGSDSWAVRQGWVSVTPLGLTADIAAKKQVTCQVLVITPSLLLEAGSLTIDDVVHCGSS